MKDNIVKSILYACVISCMAGPMSELLGSYPKGRFQLTIGFLWMLYYSAYLYDEICASSRAKLEKSCVGLDILGWVFFMLQGCTIRKYAGLSIWMGCVGVAIISWSLIRQIRKENKKWFRCAVAGEKCTCQGGAKGSSHIIADNCRWIQENIIVVVFMFALWRGHQCIGVWSTPAFYAVLSIGMTLFVFKTRILTCSFCERSFSWLQKLACGLLGKFWTLFKSKKER